FVLVPCHRVVNSNGFVGQFAHGIKSKVRMLKSEGIIIDKNNFINLKKFFYKLT
ncbi:MAG: MGMT family protein, partial [Candidatus Pacearchaeota archaeon]